MNAQSVANVQRGVLSVTLYFGDDCFGPSKVMQLFGATGQLPDFYQLQRQASNSGWLINLALVNNELNRVLLSKLKTISGLMDVKIS